jgi:23S rRNA (pseudouridine1915-N3)-methyltransferase
METSLIAVGKLRPQFRLVCDDYLRRLRRYGPLVERELRESARAATTTQRRREETARIEAAIPPRATVVALEIGGALWSSEELARRLDQWRGAAAPVALVIGGAFGLDAAFSAGARFRWSLGPLTLPHELARVIVLEQWYRAWTILRGEPYHKGVDR